MVFRYPKLLIERVFALVDKVPRDREETLKLQHFTAFAILGLPVMLGFAVYHLVAESYVAAVFIAIAAAGLGGGWLLLVKTRHGSFVYRANIVLYGALLIYSLISGGAGGSQILWMYTLPLIAFFLFGKGEGLLWSALALVLALFFLTFPPARQIGYDYPAGFVVRFVFSYLTVFAIAYWLEYFRSRYRTGMETERAELVRERERLRETIAERERAEEKRLQLERQVQNAKKLESLGVLAGGIAHDFNNLLMSVMGNAELSLKRIPPGSPARSSIDNIMIASRRAADLAQKMLAYSGRGHFVMRTVDLFEVMRKTRPFAEAAVSRGTSLVYETSAPLPEIQADAEQIGQVVLTLITNASEAIGDGPGLIKVAAGSMACDREYLESAHSGSECAEGIYSYVEVLDNGAGMDDETVARMFDPFFSTKFTGRGLGLAAALGVVRAHNGAIEVHSEPGAGTRVRVLFPAIESLSERPASREGDRGKASGARTVLVVDDEEAVLDVAQQLLASVGYQVITAENGSEGIEEFESHAGEIDCVLLDLTMPEMDGTRTFEALKKISDGVPVILASGYSKADVEDQFGDRGFAGFIQKPYTLEELESRIRESAK